MTSAAYLEQLKRLLPPGQLWLLDADSDLSNTLLVLAEEFARVDARAVDMLTESDPRYAEETIGNWETALGLPDEFVTEIPETIEERRTAVAQKFFSRGGQSDTFFIALAALCGYTVTVHCYGRAGELLRVGFLVGALVYAPAVWGWSFRIDVSAIAVDALTTEAFERVIEHAVHSYATVVFDYP